MAFTLTRDQNMQYILKGDNKHSRCLSWCDKVQFHLSLKIQPKNPETGILVFKTRWDERKYMIVYHLIGNPAVLLFEQVKLMENKTLVIGFILFVVLINPISKTLLRMPA